MTAPFRLYPCGELFCGESRVENPFSFAHVVDLHLPPLDQDRWPAEHHRAIEWWNIVMGRPQQRLPLLLDEVQAAGVDFVYFGGDLLDCYDRATAEHLVDLCRQRDLACYFQIGNHDYETLDIRYGSLDFDAEIRARHGSLLCDHWNMPDLYYSFTHQGVRCISLDTPYIQTEDGYGGLFDEAQVDWLLGQLEYDGPIIIFLHIPFNLPTIEHRMRAIWKGILACVVEDELGRRVRHAIENCQNLLGLFSGHTHMRSEDPIGENYQFITGAGHAGEWRHVRVAAGPAPKSLIAPGMPDGS